jgi:hypothetical protein
VPAVAVTVLGADGGKGEPARLEALQAASDPIAWNRRCCQSPPMLSPGGRDPLHDHDARRPCPGAWLVINNVMVAPGRPWTPNRNGWWEVGVNAGT